MPKSPSNRNLLRQLSNSLGLGELSDKLFGSEPPPVDFSGGWRCVAIEGDTNKLLETLGFSWMKRRTVPSAIGEWERLTHKGRASLEIIVVWTAQEGATNRSYALTLDGSDQKVPMPTGVTTVPASVEWEGDVIVTYYRGTKGLEMRRYFREGDNGVKNMCVEFQMPHKSGTPVTVVRVFEPVAAESAPVDGFH